jgi:hypothetical protein
MSPKIWYRALAVVLAFFTLGHTIGTRHAITPAPQEAAVISAMQGYQVPVMGFMRTYWDFYRGFSVSITVLLAALAVIAWQLGTLGQRNPREALPLAITVLLACIGQAIISFAYFFTAPMVTSIASVVCAGAGLLALRRQAAHTRPEAGSHQG